MTLRLTHASGEEIVIIHRDRPDEAPLRLRISERHIEGRDPILVEAQSTQDYLVIRATLFDRTDFDLIRFLEK